MSVVFVCRLSFFVDMFRIVYLVRSLRSFYYHEVIRSKSQLIQKYAKANFAFLLSKPQTILRLTQPFIRPRAPLLVTSTIGLAGLGLAYCNNNNSNDNYNKKTENIQAFLKAVHSGNIYKVKAALKLGADPNAKHYLGWGALHVAAVNGHRELVELLLKAGADPNLGDDYTNIYHTAREKGMHSLDVMVTREDEFR